MLQTSAQHTCDDVATVCNLPVGFEILESELLTPTADCHGIPTNSNTHGRTQSAQISSGAGWTAVVSEIGHTRTSGEILVLSACWLPERQETEGGDGKRGKCDGTQRLYRDMEFYQLCYNTEWTAMKKWICCIGHLIKQACFGDTFWRQTIEGFGNLCLPCSQLILSDHVSLWCQDHVAQMNGYGYQLFSLKHWKHFVAIFQIYRWVSSGSSNDFGGRVHLSQQPLGFLWGPSSCSCAVSWCLDCMRDWTAFS